MGTRRFHGNDSLIVNQWPSTFRPSTKDGLRVLPERCQPPAFSLNPARASDPSSCPPPGKTTSRKEQHLEPRAGTRIGSAQASPSP